ncbi:NAD-dependent epimerase/dehydratase family protein [Jannaschia seohaensis]|uniref:Nucleoside-diphosphate-sugar epimerase n=1 Tax=Jannaschia seohaensis TaxID=475081 RepID=A0A2Y9B1P3_9RHOB|nr:NAD-dependent epimerase/dehydratase family protein [Jannaschia seohaensis]PWJ13848.1 nucleoside-diphosphate-sugar epimerase [Jannaschia seohaensis]SSA50361.1 Nucleoside-diphosphate-sugar epimerase [Jannaschia seohaensis]
MKGTVLVLGASGKVGRHSSKAFQDKGWTVKTFNRRKDDMVEAAKGVDVIVNGLNPPNYHDWKTILPAVTRDVIKAASTSGATVILPGNVYHFGDQPGTWSEHTPAKPVSQKGRIRLDLERTYKESGVQTIVLRGGNFIDPDGQDCVLSTIYLRSIRKGKITLPGPKSTRQAFCYLPDWARAAAELAEMRGRLGRFEDIPFPGHTLSAEQIKEILEQALNRKLGFTKFPWPVLTLLSPVWELAREAKEMRYLWNTDHALSDETFTSLLPKFSGTAVETALVSALPPGVAPTQ